MHWEKILTVRHRSYYFRFLLAGILSSLLSKSKSGDIGGINLTIVTVLPYKSGVFFDLQMVGPALDITMEDLAVSHPEMNITMIYLKIPAVVGCDDMEDAVADYASRFYYQRLASRCPVSAWLGPGCTNAVGELASLARQWNLPVLDGTATAAFLADKRRFPTLVRFAFNQSRVMRFLQALLAFFNWTDFAIIIREGEPIWDIGITSAERFFAPFNRTVNLHILKMKKSLNEDDGLNDLLDRLNVTARVAMIFANSEFVRKLLVKAYRGGMADGQFVYFMINFVKSKFFGNPLRSLGDGNDEIATRAMQSLFVFSINQRSDEFKGFEERVYARASYVYNYSFFPDQDVNVNVIGYSDALRVYVDVLREIMSGSNATEDKQSQLLPNGLQIAQLMRNRTFRSVAGVKRLNGNGDVDGNFLIKTYNKASNDFEGAIEFNQGASDITVLTNLSAVWYAGSVWPPLNAPFCGYRNEKIACRSTDFGQAVVGAVVGAATLVIPLIFFITRRMLRDASLRESWYLLRTDLLGTIQSTSSRLYLKFRRRYHL